MEEFIPLEVVEERNEDDVINVPEDITDPHSMEELNLLKVEEERNKDDVINVPERITNKLTRIQWRSLTYLKLKKNETKTMS